MVLAKTSIFVMSRLTSSGVNSRKSVHFRISFVEDIIERQHFHTFAGGGIDIFVNGYKGNTQGGIHDFRKAITFDMLTTEAGKIFYNDRSDFAFFHHPVHTVKIAAIKACAGYAVIHKEHRIGISMLFGVIRKDLLWVADTVGFVYFAFPSFVAVILNIFNGQAAV